MIRIGVVGLGFMGGVHLRNWQAINGVDVVAEVGNVIRVEEW